MRQSITAIHIECVRRLYNDQDEHPTSSSNFFQKKSVRKIGMRILPKHFPKPYSQNRTWHYLESDGGTIDEQNTDFETESECE